MNSKRSLALLVFLGVCFTTAANSAEFHVRQDGAGDFARVQSAINMASEGDIVVVHPGIYAENIRFLGRNIEIRSKDPYDAEVVDATVIDGMENGAVVTFLGTEDETCRLSGLTIRNGSGNTDLDGNRSGGGICGGRISIPGAVRAQACITRCLIIRNNVTGCGGGIGFFDGLIANCRIMTNTAWQGGGLYGCRGDILNCEVTENTAEDVGGGLDSCQGAISDCMVTHNVSATGGGLYLCHGGITGCVVAENEAFVAGGGLAHCDGVVCGCLVYGNEARYGGGISNCDGGFVNCTFTGNEGQIDAAAHTAPPKQTRMGNCILWDNMDRSEPGLEIAPSPDVLVVHCCIRNWTGGGMGNITDDPCFTLGPYGDFCLSCEDAGQRENSSCIDAGYGIPDDWGQAGLTTRTDGAIDANNVDIGYHYFPAGSQQLRLKASITCTINKGSFEPGDTMRWYVSVENMGSDVRVDIFAGMYRPDGSIVTVSQNGALKVGIWPWASDALLPAGAAIGPCLVKEISITESAPKGQYLYAAALRPSGGPDDYFPAFHSALFSIPFDPDMRDP